MPAPDPDVARAQQRAVDRAIDHVLGHLDESLDLAALAAVAGYSPWHFQRVFRDVMGETPAAFVARARVERAVAIARAEPDRPWRDIAPEAGFSSASQMSRAFRQRFGAPARSWDRSALLVDGDRRPGHATRTTEELADGGPVVRVELLAAYRFAYRRIYDPYEPGNLAAAWDEVAAWSSAGDTPPIIVGMSWDDPATVALEACRYDLGVVLDDATPTPREASERWVPSTTAAIVRVDGDIADVDRAWEHLHRVWLPASSRRRSALPAIERFHADPRPTWERWQLDCIIPVAPVP